MDEEWTEIRAEVGHSIIVTLGFPDGRTFETPILRYRRLTTEETDARQTPPA